MSEQGESGYDRRMRALFCVVTSTYWMRMDRRPGRGATLSPFWDGLSIMIRRWFTPYV